MVCLKKIAYKEKGMTKVGIVNRKGKIIEYQLNCNYRSKRTALGSKIILILMRLSSYCTYMRVNS